MVMLPMTLVLSTLNLINFYILHCLGPSSSNFYEIWHNDAVRFCWPPGPLKIRNFETSTWRWPSSWKIRKIAIPQRQFVRFWHNLAHWCSLSLLTVPTVKHFKLRKSKMAKKSHHYLFSDIVWNSYFQLRLTVVKWWKFYPRKHL